MYYILKDKAMRINAATPHNRSFYLAARRNIAFSANRRLQHPSVVEMFR